MSTSATKEQLERQAWLLYFNRALFEKGVISEQDYRQIKKAIVATAKDRDGK